jgi:hypothetical protein
LANTVIVLTVLKVVGGVIIMALWAYGLYVRGRYHDRDQTANVQTLFSGKK